MATSTSMMYEPAPAKVNVYLHVTGKRPDGYHLLESLVAFADICDVVELQSAPQLRLEVTGPFASSTPAGEANLALKAARRLQKDVGDKPGARIILTKNLPAGAGIGGGSADAGATLRLLAQYWALPPEFEPTLQGIANSLGADVPVCLRNRTSYVSGIGERLADAHVPAGIAVLLVNPRIALPTTKVFQAFSQVRQRHGRYPYPVMDAHSLAALMHHTSNDLETPAISLVPVIGDILSELQELPGCLAARMSGSGTTCFGVFTDSEAANAASFQLRKRHPNFWVAATRLR